MQARFTATARSRDRHSHLWIVQEALTNISKYAGASAASIEVTTTATALYLQIIDNGCGFDLTHNATGFGLQGMQERVRALQGKFKIMSAPQQGCQIEAIIPLAGWA